MRALCRSNERPTKLRQQADESQRFLLLTEVFQNHAAIWVHQPARNTSDELSGHSVEVTHCFYRNRHEHISIGSPMWFYHAPGSGLSARLGNALVVDTKRYGKHRVDALRFALKRSNHFGGGSAPGAPRDHMPCVDMQ